MPSTPYSQLLTDLLPLKIRSAGDPGGPTTAKDHRAFEALEIEAIAFLESMARGNRIFVAELFDNPPEVPADVLEGDLCLDRTGNLPLWGWVDGEWVALGDLVGAAGAKILGGAGAPDPATGTLGDWYFRYNVAAFEKTPGGWVSRFGLGAGAALPTQTGNAGKLLGTDGTVASWVAPPSGLPDQTGNSGKVLTTNGTAASWSVPAATYTDTQAKDAAGALLVAGTTTTLVATYNATTHTLTWNVKGASLKVAHFEAAALVAGQFPSSQLTKLTNAGNWTAGVYTGAAATGANGALVGVEEGMFYAAGGYAFRATAANAAVCWKLTNYGS